MPELPDIEAYRAALGATVVGHPLEAIRIASPFLLRTVEPAPQEAVGRTVEAVRRVGKRLVFELPERRTEPLFLVFHLMIAGRFRWRERGVTVPRKVGLAALDFDNGSLLLTEASSKKRASLHVVEGEVALAALDPGGLEVLGAGEADFERVLRSENHTLKRALTDPHLFSGIGNAYSDEILHRARLSPFKLTSAMTAEEVERLHGAVQATLGEWTARLTAEAMAAFPEKVTAFRPEMAVHGRYRQKCPACGSPVQRIVYAENEMNYCATCQTGGRLMADRSLSRLLKDDWPRTVEELEGLRGNRDG
jgi:formamidopyrimidine-DNA glycosylase